MASVGHTSKVSEVRKPARCESRGGAWCKPRVSPVLNHPPFDETWFISVAILYRHTHWCLINELQKIVTGGGGFVMHGSPQHCNGSTDWSGDETLNPECRQCMMSFHARPFANLKASVIRDRTCISLGRIYTDQLML